MIVQDQELPNAQLSMVIEKRRQKIQFVAHDGIERKGIRIGIASQYADAFANGLGIKLE